MESNTDTMFHQGTLQSGIQRAIKENKVVACFLYTPGEHTSGIWENYWLCNNSQPTDMISQDTPPLGLVVAEKAVLLKIEAGSKEASFLKAFVQVDSTPAMVVIRNGRVLEKLGADTSKEQFTSRLLKAIGFDDMGGNGVKGVPESPPEDVNNEDEILDDIGGRHAAIDGSVEATAVTPTTAEPATLQPPPSSQSTQSSHNAQAMLADRARRLETDRSRQEAAEKAERAARANARRQEEEDATSSQRRDKGKQPAVSEDREKQQARDAWLYQQKQRKDEAKKERERILAQIENDKLERKLQQQRRKDAESAAGSGAYSEAPRPSVTPSSIRSKPVSGSCSLQVRLFDGTSIRGKFEASADIATAVRVWVKEASPEGGADVPFNFRLIQAPQPSRTIEVSEEHQSLLELGLIPSATLVLVPVAGATSAYANANRSYIGTAYSAASWAAGGVFGLLGTAWSYVPGLGGAGGNGPYIGGTGDDQEPSNAEGARMAGSDSSAPGAAMAKVNGLVERSGKKDDDVTTFYNGNSSAFEGRKDDENSK